MYYFINNKPDLPDLKAIIINGRRKYRIVRYFYLTDYQAKKLLNMSSYDLMDFILNAPSIDKEKANYIILSSMDLPIDIELITTATFQNILDSKAYQVVDQ